MPASAADRSTTAVSRSFWRKEAGTAGDLARVGLRYPTGDGQAQTGTADDAGAGGPVRERHEVHAVVLAEKNVRSPPLMWDRLKLAR